jgi:hypothetical protein
MAGLPGDRTPGGGEEEDVDADECDTGFLCLEVVHKDVSLCVLAGRGSAENSDDELRDGHADGAPEKERSTTPLVDCVKTGEGGDDVYGTGDHADDKGLFDTGILEELGAVVEDADSS